MKKIFTLLFATAMLSTAFAQYGQKGQGNKGNDVYASNDNRGFDKYDKGSYGAYIFTAREKDMEIARINREYDYKIRSVRAKLFISWFHKKRLINNLELQRDNEIHEVMHKFNSPKNKFGDYGHKDKKRW